MKANISKSRTVAAIDMGSNSFNMIVAQLDDHGHLQVVDNYKETTRLGEALVEGNLSGKAIRQAVETLKTMRNVALSYDAEIRAVATHAVRAAHNREQLLRTIQSETEIEVEIIDGHEEARLMYLGVRAGLPLENETVLGVDVGGGSTELTIAHGQDIKYVSSLKLGAVSLTKRFLDSKTVTAADIRRLRQHIMLTLAPIQKEISELAFQKAIATSGTAKALANIDDQIHGGEGLDDPHAYEINASVLGDIEKHLIKLSQPRKIREAFDLDKKRAEIIIAGTVILNSLTQALHVPKWTVSGFGFKEGIALDSFARNHLLPESQSGNIRQQTVLKLAEKLQIDFEFAKQLHFLAIRIYEQLHPLLYKDGDAHADGLNREFLHAASYLCEAGKFISFAQYHKHSSYIITQSNLMGFSQEEKQIIGYIIRYSRKKIALKDANKELFYLNRNLERINALSSYLRLAKALNRSRHNRIKDVEVVGVSEREVRLTIKYDKEIYPEVEFQALKTEENNLSKSLGLVMEYRWVSI